MALHGEDVVMILFIFFVFADSINGFVGLYHQLGYAAVVELSASGDGSTGTADPKHEHNSGRRIYRIYQNDGSTRATAPATATPAAVATTSAAATAISSTN